jgi:hypothetical protein
VGGQGWSVHKNIGITNGAKTFYRKNKNLEKFSNFFAFSK